MADAKKSGARQEPETTGHSYDGIEEYNNPLPRWWLWTFYITIAWGVVYTVLYPAWPLINGATAGVLGWSTRANVAADIAAHEAENASWVEQLNGADLASLDPKGDLHRYAFNRGKAVFRANCIQCHGAEGAGAKGYPRLSDDDWLWGGTLEEVHYTVTHGIRNDTDADAHWSQMPAFGELIERDEIEQVVEYVVQISGRDADADLASAGATVFLDNCSGCHGEDGRGDPLQGAPNLTDPIWLFGGDRETLTETVTNARFGVMPAWGQRLSEADVRAAAIYVHALGGGK